MYFMINKKLFYSILLKYTKIEDFKIAERQHFKETHKNVEKTVHTYD